MSHKMISLSKKKILKIGLFVVFWSFMVFFFFGLFVCKTKLLFSIGDNGLTSQSDKKNVARKQAMYIYIYIYMYVRKIDKIYVYVCV